MIPFAAALGGLLFIARWRGSIAGLAAAWGDPFAAVEWQGAPLRLVAIVTGLALSGCALVGIAGPGGLARAWLAWRSRAGRTLVSVALGLAMVSAAWEGLGLAGLVRPPLAWLTAAVLVPWGAIRIIGTMRIAGLPRAAVWLIGAAVFALPPILVPELEVDTLVLHLALPDAWRVAGRITADAGHGVSGFPFAQEALHLPALLLGTELPARLVGWTGAVLAALGAVTLAGALGMGGPVAWLAGTAVFTMPQLFALATHAKNDGLATGLVTIALVALLPGTRAGIAVAGLLAGTAIAAKFTAALAIPALAAAMLVRRRGFRMSPADLALGALAVLPPLLPWSVRNLLTLGSPCFPALASVLPPLGRTAVNAGLAERYLFTWSDVRPAGVLEAARDVVRILGGFTPVIGTGAILLVAARRIPRGAGWLGVFVLVYFMAWLPSLAWVSRYLLPMMPAAVVLAVARLGAIGKTGWLAGLVALAGVTCAGSGGWAARPLAGMLGLETRAAYRQRHLGPYAAALVEMRRRVPATDRVAVVGDGRRYPSDGRLVARMPDDTPLPWALAHESADAGRLPVMLRQRRIRWLLHHPAQAAFWADYPMRFGWTAPAARRWAAFWDGHATLVWHSDPVQDLAGSAWLFALDRRPGDRPFPAWLPGTEGAYSRVRRLVESPQPGPELAAEVGDLAGHFGGRPEFLARRAVVRAIANDRAGAVRDLAAAVRAAPGAIPLWVSWGAYPVSRETWAHPDRLAARFDAMSADGTRWSVLFNLGIPFCVPLE